tara:strand:- start:754 stop:1005 length:252 start_codon:yes stop_codon:yes gene_type:complete
MLRVYKFFKHYSCTTTIPIGSYKFDLNKKINPQKYNGNVLIGTTESHAIPIRPDELKVSIYKKNDKKLKVKEKEAEDIINFIY